MVKSHAELIRMAKEILRERGFKDDEIYEEFGFKNYRIDTVGWSDKQKVAIECGHFNSGKYEELKKFFDDVIHLPFEEVKEPLINSEAGPLEIATKLNAYKILEILSNLIRTEIFQSLIRAYPNKLTISELQELTSEARMTVWFHINKLREASLVELNGSRRGFRAAARALTIRFNGDGIRLEKGG